MLCDFYTNYEHSLRILIDDIFLVALFLSEHVHVFKIDETSL